MREPAIHQSLAKAFAAHIEASADARLKGFVRDLRELPPQHEPTMGAGRPVRGLCHLGAALNQSSPLQDSALMAAARAAIGWAGWSEFYAEDDWSRSFIDGFANGDLIGPTAPWRSDRLILGLFVYGPEMDYPPHAHPALEVYCLLTGEAEFQIGAEAPYERYRPGELIFHDVDVSHAIRTFERPVFGLYAWRGSISAPSWYREPMGDAGATKRYPRIVRG